MEDDVEEYDVGVATEDGVEESYNEDGEEKSPEDEEDAPPEKDEKEDVGVESGTEVDVANDVDVPEEGSENEYKGIVSVKDGIDEIGDDDAKDVEPERSVSEDAVLEEDGEDEAEVGDAEE